MTTHSYRILAVDDEQDALSVIERALEDDYEILTAGSGAEALEILRVQQVDLLLTDQRMPEMTGIELIEHARKIQPQMMRIILTGYTEPKDLIDAINRGQVYRYITKPWDLNDLLFTIRNGLETYQLRRDKEKLLSDLELRLNAMTVFLDLSKEAAKANSYPEIIRALLKYLPFMLEFDACAALLEQGVGTKAFLYIHRRKPMGQEQLFEIRKQTLEAYRERTGRLISEDELLLQVTGQEPGEVEHGEFVSQVATVLHKSDDKPLGLIMLFDSRKDSLGEDAGQMLDILANQTAEIVDGLRKQLSTEQERLRLMVQSLPDGVIMVDDQDSVFVINPAARKLLHLSPDAEVDTRFLKDTLGFYPFDLVRGWAIRDREALREEIQVFDRVLQSIVSPVSLDDKLLGVAVVLRDITEDKRLEERKDEFVSIVSHELRTPLTSIGGALDLLIHRYAGELNEKQDRYLELARGGCDKLNTIISDLLDLNRYASGKMDMRMTRLDLNALAKEAIDQYQAAAEERQVHLELRRPEDMVHVWGDRNRLHQVLNNLLSNALKFTQKDGTIRLQVLSSPLTSDLVGLSVYNNGEEIVEQDHARIFDKFEQAKRTRSGAVSGSGLGLSISKNIVDAHGGSIWVESGRGQGTEFIITLPAYDGQKGTEEARTLPGLMPSLPKFKTAPSLLVVDDDINTTYVIKGLMMSQGYHVCVAHSGKEALELARERLPSLILMDIRMPDVDGLQITDILHHDPETREIPVLVLSVAQEEQAAFEAGAAAFLSKPVDVPNLLEQVLELLEKRRLVKRMFKVLIVDDDPAIREVSRGVLEEQGYAVVEAGSGEEAIKRLEREQVDVVLLDVMLPDMDGFQVTEQIRSDRKLKDLPIIFISARGQTKDKVKALKLGGDDYMVKPFDTLELGARVDAIIQRKERELDSSPTTKLPGSLALQREINRRLLDLRGFSLCYLVYGTFL